MDAIYTLSVASQPPQSNGLFGICFFELRANNGDKVNQPSCYVALNRAIGGAYRVGGTPVIPYVCGRMRKVFKVDSSYVSTMYNEFRKS